MNEKSVLRVLAALSVGISLTSGPAANAQSVVNVSTATELESAVSAANAAGGNRTILLADGTYTVSNTLYVTAPNVTIAGQAGHRASVVIQGDAMSASAVVGDVIHVNASNFALHDATVQRSRWHLIQVAGEHGAQAPVIKDCVLRDAYEQLLKVSQDLTHPNVTSNNGLVENCIFEYSAGIGPEWYIGGIDAHGAQSWIVRGNTFRNIISPNTAVAEFAVHFWDSPAANNLVEKNTIINCDRGIGFGLGSRGNSGGIIRNNMIYHAAGNGQFADVGISLQTSPGSQVYNNTVFYDDAYQAAIEYRFTATTNVLIENNLSNRPIQQRDGATGSVSTNVTSAVAGWFVNPPAGDLHLASAVPGVVHAGQAIADLTDDFDGQPRPPGAIDIGADQFETATVPEPPTNVQVH